MRVLIVRSRAVDPSVKKIASALGRNGFEVHLLLWDRTGQQEDAMNYLFQTHYCRIRAPYDSILAIVYLPLWWLTEMWFLLRNSNRKTIIHACDFDTLWPAVLVKLLRGIPLNYSILDFYADNIPQGIPRFIRHLIAKAEKFGLRFTETTFLADESRLIQIDGAVYNNIDYIYNTPPELIPAPEAIPSMGPRSFTLFYAGVLHESRGLRQMLEAIRGIENVVFVVAGTGPESHLIEDIIKAGNQNITYLGWIPYDEVIRQSMASDCIIAQYDPSIPNNRFASPNKLFEAMMCSKPIIVSDGSSMAEIVRRMNCGCIVPYGDPSAIRAAVERLRDDPDLCGQLGDNGREAYDKSYSWEIMEGRLVAAYLRVTNASTKWGLSDSGIE